MLLRFHGSARIGEPESAIKNGEGRSSDSPIIIALSSSLFGAEGAPNVEFRLRRGRCTSTEEIGTEGTSDTSSDGRSAGQMTAASANDAALPQMTAASATDAPQVQITQHTAAAAPARQSRSTATILKPGVPSVPAHSAAARPYAPCP